MSQRIVLATRNEHKVHEVIQILGSVVAELDLEIVPVSLYPHLTDVLETEATFEGNASLKARSVAAATGLPALADDSGLAVDVLGGSPGVFSARWSGSRAGSCAARVARDDANLRLLLEQLADVTEEHRSAAFVCAAVLATPDGRTVGTLGRMGGTIGHRPVGVNGFGYDPIFHPSGGERSLAEYSAAEKNAISHRGVAFRALAPLLPGLLTPGT